MPIGQTLVISFACACKKLLIIEHVILTHILSLSHSFAHILALTPTYPTHTLIITLELTPSTTALTFPFTPAAASWRSCCNWTRLKGARGKFKKPSPRRMWGSRRVLSGWDPHSPKLGVAPFCNAILVLLEYSYYGYCRLFCSLSLYDAELTTL